MDPILLLKCKVLAIKLLIIELYKNNIMLYISYTMGQTMLLLVLH